MFLLGVCPVEKKYKYVLNINKLFEYKYLLNI